MPKIPRKDSKGETEAKERGDTKQLRVSVEPPGASGGANEDRFRRHKRLIEIEISRSRSPSPDSPHKAHLALNAEDEEEVAEHVLKSREEEEEEEEDVADVDKERKDSWRREFAAYLSGVVEKAGHFQRDLTGSIHTRLVAMADRTLTSPMIDAADKLLRRTREALALKSGRGLGCANKDPGAALRQDGGAREVTFDNWQRSTDKAMVHLPSDIAPTEPTDHGHMSRPHGEPSLTSKMGLLYSA